MASDKITALEVSQWLSAWDKVKFDKKENREKPQPKFFLFTIRASVLKKLSKVYPRRADEKREVEIGVQRKHDPERSAEIRKYVEYGYPLSDLVKDRKIPTDLEDLRMPGWLPTAIVANILKENTQRGSYKIKKEDIIRIEKKGDLISLSLPIGVNDANWNPDVPPIEIIDGQHRLWAFNENNVADEFELPVVAFYDLDVTWQAYLFYTINVKPKKINRSLAYDLYPLLRVQEWLERSPETAHVYKETRAQEIVEVLWSYTKSPWRDKINMLGDTRKSIGSGRIVPNITQAAYIRNLIASFIKTTTTKGLGGLFGAKLNDDYQLPLNWNRTQQASFLVYVWQTMQKATVACKNEWAVVLKKEYNDLITKMKIKGNENDYAFVSSYSLLSSDQGVRGFLHIINDVMFTLSSKLELRGIKWTVDGGEIKEDKIAQADIDNTIKDFEKSKINDIVKEICNELMKFDWRTSSEPNLTEDQRKAQMIFKGSSGYKELRTQLLEILSKSKNVEIKNASKKIMLELGYAH